jgi:hypothetical protein
VTPDQLEQLLYESEGTTLDFKQEQYPFAKASEDEKSELLKDILGFVNCWRRAEAFILIGVEDVPGGRGVVHGISEHLPDHSLQQFVNNLTHRPAQFGYEACEIDGKQVGIIRIPVQKRPVYLTKDYGKLKKKAVYVRRGSSTDPTRPADPDEISQMANDLGLGAREASLTVEFAELERDESIGDEIEWSAEYCVMPPFDEIPDLVERGPDTIHLPGGRTWTMPDLSGLISHERLDRHYFRKLANYVVVKRLVRRIRLVITNTGEVPADNVRLEIRIPTDGDLRIVAEHDIPYAPKKCSSMFDTSIMRHVHAAQRRAGAVNNLKTGHEARVEIDCGNLQPGRKVWTDELHVAVIESGEVAINGLLFSANLPQPQEFVLRIIAEITRTTMTVEELTSLDEPHPAEE